MSALLGGSKTLVLAPHTDDETHVGGTIHRMIREGYTVKVVAFSACEESVPDGYPKDVLVHEFNRAVGVLGVERSELFGLPVRLFPEHRQTILERMVKLAQEFQPDIVLCPGSFDRHQDHATVRQEAERAFRNAPALLGWESPHNQRKAVHNLFMELDGTDVDAKLAALDMYQSQSFRVHTDNQFFRSLAVMRGQMARVRTGFAEAFEVISMTVRG